MMIFIAIPTAQGRRLHCIFHKKLKKPNFVCQYRLVTHFPTDRTQNPSVNSIYHQAKRYLGALTTPQLCVNIEHTPHVGVMGVGVKRSVSKTGAEQAKKTQTVNGDGQFSKQKMVPDPPHPNPYISEKPFSRAFRIYPIYPP